MGEKVPVAPSHLKWFITLKTRLKDWRVLAALFFSFSLISVWASYQYLPAGVDFHAFRDAARMLIAGRSPYGNGFYNPPWALLPIIPISLLSEQVGSAINAVLGLLVILYIAHRLGASKMTLLLLALSPPVLFEFRLSNISYLSLVGLIAPPAIGLIFAVIKPHLMIGMVIYWLFSQRRSMRNLVWMVLPVTALLIISFVLYGCWPLMVEQLEDRGSNVSLWPASIPVGITLMVLSIRRNDPRSALAASPFLTPYISLAGYIPLLLALVSKRNFFPIAFLISWIIFIIRWGIIGFPQ